MKTKEYWVVIVKRPIGIDKLYRKTEVNAIEIKNMYKNLYPTANITLTKEEVEVDERGK